MEDAHRNALNAHCYWNLRQNGLNRNEATKRIEGLSVSMKNELLHSYDINFNDLPNWQKRGIGIYWEKVKSTGVNPLSNEKVEVVRRQLTVQMDLPMGDAYNRYITELIQKNESL